MRILFVSDTYYPHLNGVYYFVCRLAPLLQARGHQVAVIVPSETIQETFKKIDDIDVYGMPGVPILLYPKVRLPITFLLEARLKKIIKNFEPDIIHLQDHFTLTAAMVKANKLTGVPIIGTNHFMPENITVLFKHDTIKEKIAGYLWKRFSKVYNQLSVVTTPSETGADLIRPKLKVKVVAISSGIDLTVYNPLGDTKIVRKKYNIPDKPILLYAGRVDPEKRLEEVIHAVALAVKMVDFTLVIVGKGKSKASLELLTQQLGIEDKVIFTGYVPEEDLPVFYKLSNCFIIASIAELLSLVTLQAMGCALPIIAVNAGALGELVNDNVNGFLFESGDINTIAESIYKIISNKELQNSMAKKSLEYITKHDINNTLLAFENVYKQQMIVSTTTAFTVKPGRVVSSEY